MLILVGKVLRKKNCLLNKNNYVDLYATETDSLMRKKFLLNIRDNAFSGNIK